MQWREIATKMDPLAPPRSLRKLAALHRWAPPESVNPPAPPPSISLREMISRHERTGRGHRFCFYNTYLLGGLAGFADKPLLDLRAFLIGRFLARNDYSVAALCEVFDDRFTNAIRSQFAAVAADVDVAMGPDSAGFELSSGLSSVTRDVQIVRSERHVFEEDGRFIDTDAYAQKGVLLTTVDFGIGNVDFYSTHLYFGDSLPLPVLDGVATTEHWRSTIRQAQVLEIVDFIERTRDPRHVVVLTGDFNIAADQAGYAAMMDALDTLGLEDVWLSRGGDVGGTTKIASTCPVDLRVHDEHGDEFCGDFRPLADESERDRRRIDYVFIERPTVHHTINVDLTRLRRRAPAFEPLALDELEAYAEAVGTLVFAELLLFRVNDSPELVVQNGEVFIRFTGPLGIQTILHPLTAMERQEIVAQLNEQIPRVLANHSELGGSLSDHLALDTWLTISARST